MPSAADEREVLAQIMAVCREVHGDGARPLSLDSDLAADAGLDSLALVEVTDRLDQAFRVKLDPEVVAAAATPRDLLRAVRQMAPSADTPEGPAYPADVGMTAPVMPQEGRVRPPRELMEGKHRERPESPLPLLWPTEVATLNEALARHAASWAGRRTIRLFAGHQGAPVDEITYGALYDEALSAANGLLATGLEFGERVGVMLPTSREYFAVFCGVLLAGGVPVPLYPPARMATLRSHLEAQGRILENAGASLLVTTTQASALGRLVQARVPSLRSVPTPQALMRPRMRGPLPVVTAPDMALIQYTSGSTGEPKGVVLTQAQLLANMTGMAEAAKVTASDAVVTWLPLYHDMGLIGLWLTPLVLGLPTTVLSPLTFLSRPASWLQAMTEDGGTISAAPNFAYQACVDRVTEAELATLDLSAWRLAFNGSEAVSIATVDAFAARFGPSGFDPHAMCPAYGLAEAGVGLAFSPPGRGPSVDTVERSELASSGRAIQVAPGAPGARSIVGCGYPLPGYEVRVTGPGGIELPERREGRVECRGPSTTAGYYANEAATRSLWRHGWLDTGDLGYVADGELYLTGRRKDLVIRGGRNLHPEDLEEPVGRLPGVEPGRVAVFASPDPRLGTERLVVAVETAANADTERRQLEDDVRHCIAELVELAPDVVALVPPGSILRTPSGKIRRDATRQAFESGTLGGSPAPLPVQLVQLAIRDALPAGRRAARLIGAWSFALGAWALVALVGVPVWFAVHLPIPRSLRWRLVRRAGHALSVLCGIPVRVEGTLPPASRPCVLVANHPSFVDGLVIILTSPDPLTFVTSTELERIPAIGSFLRRIGCRFVTRGDPGSVPEDVASLADALRRGERLAFFPEGSLAPVRGVRPFHLGAFAVAAATGAAIVPLGIQGSEHVVRPGSYLPRRATVRVIVGAPMEAPQPSLRDEASMAESLRGRIAELSGEPAVGPAR